MARTKQVQLDANRKTYQIAIPPTMSENDMKAWVRSIGGNLDSKLGALSSRPTIVFELHGKNFGLEHRIRVPDTALAGYLISQLRQQVKGVTITPVESDPVEYTYGIEIEMTDGARSLRIASVKDHANRVLASAGALEENEHVTLSVVISHTNKVKVPPTDKAVAKSHNSLFDLLVGNLQAGRDEIQDRREKASEPCFNAVIRVGAVASSNKRAKDIVERIEHALRSENNQHAMLKSKKKSNISELINTGKTPGMFFTQLSTSELVAVVGWPIDGPSIAGLPSGVTKQLPADPVIPTSDPLPIGMATFPGGERRLTYDAVQASRHTYVPGVNGVGKTTWMLNLFSAAVNQGHGAIIFDTKKDIALGALDYVPQERLDDVIYLNFMDLDHPIGFNPLDQGRASATIDETIRLLAHVYKDIKSVNARQQLHHGMHALAEASETTGKQYTMLDLLPLLNPVGQEEIAWSRELIKNLNDRALKRWFKDWQALRPDARLTKLEALDNRYWQFDRPELRNVIGQSKSAFQMKDVILGNKILIVNMVGMNDDSRELAAVLLMNALWGAVREHTPEKENFLFLDEFADIINIPVSFESMLAKARSAKFPMVLANQEFGQLTREMQSALMANAVTKIAFTLSSNDGSTIANELGRTKVSAEDLINLPKHTAIARIATSQGASPPVSLTTFKPFDQPRRGTEVIYRSRALAIPPEAVEQQGIDRRMARVRDVQERRPLGETSLDDEE